jgi:hypothetical protein
MLERPLSLPWAVAAAAAFAFVALCLLMAPEGRVSAWALAALALSAGLTAAVVLNAVTRDQLARYRARHKPLAGPQRGARLPR